jgi:Ca2+-binding RTX toxin-like protein
VPNRDVVVLGADDGAGFGSEVVWTGPMAADGRLDGGGGARLAFDTGTGSVAIDATAGFLAEDGVTTLRWTGFDRFRTGSKATPAPARFEFLGSDRDEELEIVFAKAHQGRQRIAMGGGADTLLLGDENLGARGSRYLGGPGEDHVALWAGKRLDLDLQRERIKTKPAGSTFRSTFADFETQLVGAKKLVLKGTNKSDELRFYACKATVKGRGGADDIRQSRGDDYFEAGLRCNPRKFRLFGGGGKDTLQGSTGRDLLVGGPGRDTINGNRGRDTCSGEKLRSCEIKRR